MTTKTMKQSKTTRAPKRAVQPEVDGLGDEKSEEHIRHLAYLKWEAAGMPAGDGVCYWLEAEREVAGNP